MVLGVRSAKCEKAGGVPGAVAGAVLRRGKFAAADRKCPSCRDVPREAIVTFGSAARLPVPFAERPLTGLLKGLVWPSSVGSRVCHGECTMIACLNGGHSTHTHS